jgi:hypothetical protein
LTELQDELTKKVYATPDLSTGLRDRFTLEVKKNTFISELKFL